MHKIIIDTDPGIDDAMAILFAHAHPEIELLGLTTVFGNIGIDQSTDNALRIIDVAGINIPVCKGAATSLKNPEPKYPTFVHGEDGLGNVNLPVPDIAVDKRSAVDYLAETISQHPNEIVLIAIGPLTNIAQLVLEHPDIASKVKEVIAMGGSVFAPGNVTPMAEANIYSDPEAADIVFNTNWPFTLVSLDITMKTILTDAEFTQIAKANTKISKFLQNISTFYIDFYVKHRNRKGCAMHDVVAVALPVASHLFKLEKGRLRVPTEGFCRGQTAAMPEHFTSEDAEWNKRPMVNYTMDIDASKMRDLFVDTVSNRK